MSDVIIPIVFPDYKIATPVGKIGELGHAGVLFIQGKNGESKYYEYGRYDKAGRGLVRKKTIPDVKIDRKTGKPTDASLAKTLHSISVQSGSGTRISGAYIEISGGYLKAKLYASKRHKDNNNSKRESYDLFSNNCGTFMKETAEAAGASMPWQVDPRPNSYIEEIRDDYPDVNYDPKTKTLTIK